jgi:hypothetical protein
LNIENTVFAYFTCFANYNNHQFASNLFLGFYIPARNSVSLWDLETDYYLHNCHHEGEYSMEAYERHFGIEQSGNRKDDSVSNLNGDRGPEHEDAQRRSRFESDAEEWIRKRCEAQQERLSQWWKSALQAYVQQRMWMRNCGEPDESLLPTRFDRLYQPEKIAQFDRFFSRGWATPVRRSHSAQHAEGRELDASKNYMRRIVSSDYVAEPIEKSKGALRFRTTELLNFFAKHGYEPKKQSDMKRFASCHEIEAVSNINFIGGLHLDESKASELYRRFALPASEVFDAPHVLKTSVVDEYRRCLNDYMLDSDDVDGIRKVRVFKIHCFLAYDSFLA